MKKSSMLLVFSMCLVSRIALADTFFWEDKKGIHATEDVSQLPPKFRQKYNDYLKQNPKPQKASLPITEAAPADKPLPESAKNAIKALKKMQARCQAGILPKDYSGALADTLFEVNMYVKSDDGRNGGKLTELVASTLEAYKKAGESISEGATTTATLNGYGRKVAAVNNKQAYDEIAETYMRAASYGIDNIDNLLRKKE